MISCAFPPIGGPGVQRSVKFAKYLPQFGWEPTVWATDRWDGLPLDETLLDDLPADITVHRWSRETARGRAWHLVRDRINGGAEGDGDGSLRSVTTAVRSASAAARSVSRIRAGLRWRLDQWNLRRQFPDPHAAWARSSVGPLCRLLAEDGGHALYSTFSPASNHWLGMVLKQRTGLPWIADFRDLWTQDYRYRGVPSRGHGRRVARADAQLELRILRTADAVIGVTPRQTAMLAQRVPEQAAKFVTITNGYDPDDFDEALRDNRSHDDGPPGGTRRSKRGVHEPHSGVHRPHSGAHRFVLAHVGRLEAGRVPDALIDALRSLARKLKNGRELTDKRVANADYELRIVGHVSDATRSRLSETGIPCTFHPYESHHGAIRRMVEADALLLVVPDAPRADNTIPAKSFEYLAAGRPILHVGPPNGQTARLVQACKAGITVPFDARAICDALWHLYRCQACGTPLAGCTLDRLAPFDRVSLTQRLADVLDRIAPISESPGAHNADNTAAHPSPPLIPAGAV